MDSTFVPISTDFEVEKISDPFGALDTHQAPVKTNLFQDGEDIVKDNLMQSSNHLESDYSTSSSDITYTSSAYFNSSSNACGIIAGHQQQKTNDNSIFPMLMATANIFDPEETAKKLKEVEGILNNEARMDRETAAELKMLLGISTA